ncbi:MAG: TIGR01212 family radical SAM protein [Bacilli bacterium]|nr:TIGR01212 family radical SAM protein [Bacilli bacterium]
MSFKYSDSNKRYYTLDYYYKHKYKSKVFKVSLDGGFTCPNIDGTVGYGGCIYCSNGNRDFAGNRADDLVIQFEKVKKMLLKKWPKAKYIAYFGSYTNTYAPIEELKEKYEQVAFLDDVVGINIATRADAITDECLDYLEELNKRTDVTIELGLQTTNEETSKLINRCHSLEILDEMVHKLNKINIKVIVHIINGLPYEKEEDMLNTIKHLNKLNIWGIKIHMLSIMKNTKLEKMYKEKPFHLLTKEEYVDIVVKQLEHLKEDIVICRITGDPKKEDLVEPDWLIKKFCVMNDIDKLMVKKDTYQGRLYEGNS